MNYFYEILNKRIGYSRIGRIILSKEKKKYIKTPDVVLPMRNFLMKNLNFLEEFEQHKVFMISKEIFLKIGFLREKFKETNFIFTHNGILKTFIKIINDNFTVLSEDNIIVLIPFNIPTTYIDKDFTKNEIIHYIKNVKILLNNYPELNFGLSIKIFEHPELIELYSPLIKNNENIKLLNLGDFFDSNTNFRKILEVIINIKQNFDNNLVLMASGRIIPKYFPILIYLGIDLIDSSYLLYLCSENFYDTIEFLLPIYKMKYFPCSCLACRTKLKNLQNKKYSSEKFSYLCLHNLITAKAYMNKIKQYLENEDFRAFVEKTCFDDVMLISILKILDRQYYDLVKYETPITDSNSIIKCYGPSSYYRPDFEQFRERLINNFSPEPWTKLIILLPCSARKPYSQSKSHKKFHSVLRKFPDFPDFQEIILTSPLGAIPRQLENVYPVNCYDISVTGYWDNEEIDLASNMLVKLINKYNIQIPILCHINEKGYKDIVLRAQSQLPHKFYFSEIQKNLINSNSLKSLEDNLRKLKDIFKLNDNLIRKNTFSKSWVRKLIKIADYQFGSNIGMELFSKGIKVKKNRRDKNLDIIDITDKKLLGRFLVETGQILLNLNGAKILSTINKKSNCLIFNGDSIRGSTLFRPGVIDFSPDLIPNNVVIILDNKKKDVIGVAKLVIGSNYIKNSKNGKVAMIYEKSR